MTTDKKQYLFEMLFRAMFPKVKAFAFKLLQSGSDAEDIAQDVFVKVWNSPPLHLGTRHELGKLYLQDNQKLHT